MDASTDPEAVYSRLFLQSGPQLWRTIYVFAGGRRDVADDAVAMAFARALERQGTIRDPLPWLYRTAFRLAAEELRRRPAPVERIPESDNAAGEDVIDLIRALRSLSPGQRAAVVLHYQADLPVREVARLMGTSTAAVKVHLHRGRSKLRQLLGEKEDQG